MIYCLVVDLKPLWKMMEWVRQLGWWHSQLNGKIKAMFQTTNQYMEKTRSSSESNFQTRCGRKGGSQSIKVKVTKIVGRYTSKHLDVNSAQPFNYFGKLHSRHIFKHVSKFPLISLTFETLWVHHSSLALASPFYRSGKCALTSDLIHMI